MPIDPASNVKLIYPTYFYTGSLMHHNRNCSVFFFAFGAQTAAGEPRATGISFLSGKERICISAMS